MNRAMFRFAAAAGALALAACEGFDNAMGWDALYELVRISNTR